jgi:hypothetical protein
MGGQDQWRSHQREAPSNTHSPALNTMARIQGNGEENRITPLVLVVPICGSSLGIEREYGNLSVIGCLGPNVD